MDANKHANDHGYDNMARRLGRVKSGTVRGSHFGQVSCGRRIVASKYQQCVRSTIPSSSICTQNSKSNIRDVQLKHSTGMVVGRGIAESELKAGDDVDGLILFPHQVAVRLTDVFTSGVQKMNEDGQVLRECIGQILRWSRTFIEEINMESQERRLTSTANAAYAFNEDILPGHTIRARNIEDCEEDHEQESMERSRSEGTMRTKQSSCPLSRVDGLPSTLKKRQYRMAHRVRKEKGPQRSGSSRAKLGHPCKCGRTFAIKHMLKGMFEEIGCRCHINEKVQSVGIA